MRISEKKLHHIKSGEVLSNFYSFHLLFNLNPDCPVNLNKRCTLFEYLMLRLAY